MKSNPIAVLISDVHYNLQTLQVADKAMRLAIVKANDLEVPLIVAGDLHDTKANLRGECVAAMLATFKLAETGVYILRGNHDQINEKSFEHSLEFLRAEYGRFIIDSIEDCTAEFETKAENMWLIPYQHDPEKLVFNLATIPKGSLIIMHQGVQNTNAGHYIQDNSALPKECFADFRVISGHYHTRQTIKCGRPRKNAVGAFDYIGNPYTLNFGEANDPEKGFQILYNDGSLEFVSTNLRKHVIIEAYFDFDGALTIHGKKVNPEDIVLVRLKGIKQQLNSNLAQKQNLKRLCEIPGDFRLDLIPRDQTANPEPTLNLSKPDMLDALIDSLGNTSLDQKTRLKSLWRDL